MQIVGFYQAFAPACFALLGLWFVVVQIRYDHGWKDNPDAQHRAYGVALNFALPGVMSLLALVDVSTHTFWRVSFAIAGFGGAAAMVFAYAVHLKAQRSRTGSRLQAFLFGVGSYASIVFYVAVGALACVGGADALRAVAVLQTTVVFLGFNLGWLLLIEGGPPAPQPSTPSEPEGMPVERTR
jgi:hypothetical protein